MKILLVNGSPTEKGCTYTALSEVAGALNSEGAQTEILQIGKKPVQGCTNCKHCQSAGKCAFDDLVNEAAEKAKDADGFVFGSPVYYGAVSGQMTSFMNRFFFSSGRLLANKPGAAVVCCRRAGSTAALDQIYKYMVISNMLLMGAMYWPMVHGFTPDDVRRDREGMQTMRIMGRNMAWIIKSIEAGREAGVQLPKPEPERFYTNFMD